jgi:hypothetical protein
MRQGRTQPQSNEIFDEKRVDYSGWITMRVVSDGRHFRGYLNNEMYVHGHGNPPENGPVGLRLEGKGTVLLKNMYAESIR